MMDKTKQDRRKEWQRKRVQLALDYHNRKYGTNIIIKDKARYIYPTLRGKRDWDWVCHDTKTGDEIALEVKKLTDEELEKRQNLIWDILIELRDKLLNKLPGTFVLGINFLENYPLQLRGQQNKQEFKDILYRAIFQTAKTLKLGEERNLTPQILGQLPFARPDSFVCELQKVSNRDSLLRLSSGVTGFWSKELGGNEFVKFGQLVSDANEKLKKAKDDFNVKETFLVFICEGLRLANQNTVAGALNRMSQQNYSQINHIYYVSGEEVTDISLLTP